MRWITLALVVSLLGCASSLVVKETDTGGQKAAKVTARVGLDIVSLGLAEIPLGSARRKHAADVRRMEELQRREAWQAAVDGVRTMSEITKLFGSAPDSCFSSSTEAQICTWTLGREQMVGVMGWTTVSVREIGWDLTTVCELPKDGSARGPDSCQLTFE
jgi:hypothetical protein